MNIPFFSKYGTKYAPSSGAQAGTDLATIDPGNTGDFVSVATEDARASVSGINNNYGNSTFIRKHMRTYLPKKKLLVL